MSEEAVLDIEQPVEADGAQQQSEADGQQQSQQEEARLSPEQQARKSSREYQEWLKGLRTDDPNTGRFAKQAKDDHFRNLELAKLDPRGLDGIREKYALLDSISHGDLKGPEALNAIQDELQTYYSTDDRIVNGDASVLDEFDEEMKGGIMKMMPNLLEMQRTADPEAFERTILPHAIGIIRSSGLLQNHNAMVDALEEQPPSWLPKERVEAWYQDKFRKLATILDTNGNALNAQLSKAKETTTSQQQSRGKDGQSKPNDKASDLDSRERDFNWNSKVQPQLLNDVRAIFRQEFQPFSKNLRLDAVALKGLEKDFLERLLAAGKKDSAFSAQMDRFYKSRNPIPATVHNYAKAFFSKPDVGKAVMTTLVNERYKPFLNGKGNKPAAQQQSSQNGGRPIAPPGPKEYVVSVRPPDGEIYFKHPKFPELRAQGKFPMKNGKVAILRA